MQPSIQYWTDHTQPNRTQTPNQTPSLISVTAQGQLQVCYGGPRDKDPGWPLSRPRVDIKSRPISEADPKITFQCLSKIVYLDYTRGGLTGGKKKDDSASHFNGWADHKSWPRSAYRVCFDVRLCLVGTVVSSIFDNGEMNYWTICLSSFDYHLNKETLIVFS